MASFNKHDLQFILKQIEIAERHAAGEDLATLVGNPLLPYGLRTVDGTYNNLLEGREEWGAADTSFPRLLTPDYATGTAPTTPFPIPGGSDYSQGGNIIDTAPRIISNLVVDQTLNNPAALTAALKWAGVTGSEATTAVSEIAALYNTLKAAQQAAGSGSAEIAQAQAAFTAATAAQTAAAAANAAAQAALTGYTQGAAAADAADDDAQALLVALAQLQLGVADQSLDAADTAFLSSALIAATELLAGTGALVAALQGAGSGMAPAHLASAQSLAGSAASLQSQLTGLNTALTDGTVTPADAAAAVAAFSASIPVLTDASALTSQLNGAIPGATTAAQTAATDLAAANDALADAQADLQAAIDANGGASEAVAQVQAALNEALGEQGIEVTENGSLVIPNIAPDEGISARSIPG